MNTDVTLNLTQQESAILASIVAIGAAVAFGDVRGRREFNALEARFTNENDGPNEGPGDTHPTNTLFGKLIPLAEAARENYPAEHADEPEPVKDAPSGVIDLMAALKQSLANEENVS